MVPNTEIASTDPNLVIASVAGFLQHKDGVVGVNECFIVDGSVDFSTGNIAYEQSAVIRGDVSDGFSVNVGGALEVGGGVGEAKLLVGGDVLIRKGFVGSGHGLITAKGGISLGFSSNQTIRAHGDVVLEKESFNCQIYSRKGISVYGTLVGGLAMASREILCRVAGNDLGTKTDIEAGMDYVLHENKILLEEKLKELTAHLGKINLKLTRFRDAYRIRKRFTASEAKLMMELSASSPGFRQAERAAVRAHPGAGEAQAGHRGSDPQRLSAHRTVRQGRKESESRSRHQGGAGSIPRPGRDGGPQGFPVPERPDQSPMNRLNESKG